MSQTFKIRTEEDVQLLEDKLKNDLGIDVRKYRNPEVAEKFVDLLVFPQYVIKWVLIPILAVLLLYLLGFEVLILNDGWMLIYSIFGFLLFLINGVFFGLILVMRKFKADMYSVIEYSLIIMKDCITDLRQVHETTNGENRKDTLNLLFLGITHIVTIPMVTVAIRNKIPLIGGLISDLIKRALRLIASRMKFDYAVEKVGVNMEDNPERVTNTYINSIDQTMRKLNRLLTVILRIGQVPILILTLITLSFLGILLLIVT